MKSPVKGLPWSDYLRLRRKPIKECLGCHAMLPNDRDHFHTGPTGYISAHCLECRNRPAPGPTREMCPVCGRHTHLVRDTRAPAPSHICRRCLLLANMLTVPGVEARLREYLDWRTG
jgi:ribosomal protein S14